MQKMWNNVLGMKIIASSFNVQAAVKLVSSVVPVSVLGASRSTFPGHHGCGCVEDINITSRLSRCFEDYPIVGKNFHILKSTKSCLKK